MQTETIGFKGKRFLFFFILTMANVLFLVNMAASETIPSDWKKIDADGHFEFFLPPDMEMKPSKGIDSHVGKYQSPTIHLSFDYGWYSDPLEFSSRPNDQETSVQIDGKKARIVTYSSENEEGGLNYTAAVHFARVDEAEPPGREHKLTMVAKCKTAADQAIARQIFLSIKFHDTK